MSKRKMAMVEGTVWNKNETNKAITNINEEN